VWIVRELLRLQLTLLSKTQTITLGTPLAMPTQRLRLPSIVSFVVVCASASGCDPGVQPDAGGDVSSMDAVVNIDATGDECLPEPALSQYCGQLVPDSGMPVHFADPCCRGFA
jgi:hypothetical protein